MKLTVATKANSADMFQQMFYLKDQLCELPTGCLFTSKFGEVDGVHCDSADVG